MSVVSRVATLDEYCFHYDQANLSKVCSDRPLTRCEIAEGNDYYGNAKNLKQYLGLRASYQFKFVLEHSVYLGDDIWTQDAESKVPLFLSNSPSRAKLHRQKTKKRSIPIGYGFLYAIENFRNQHGGEVSSGRRGTIVFPSHSTHHIMADFDIAGYADYLVDLPEKFQPVVVCIYWKDYLNGSADYYRQRGLSVVSAGHLFDSMFFLRLYDICRQFEYSTSNLIGGSLFMSVASGCKYFFAQPGVVGHHDPRGVQLGGAEYFSNENFKRLERCFSFDCVEVQLGKKLSVVDEYMGLSSRKGRFHVWLLVIFSEIIDKFFPVCDVRGKMIRPFYFQRHGYKAGLKKMMSFPFRFFVG